MLGFGFVEERTIKPSEMAYASYKSSPSNRDKMEKRQKEETYHLRL